MSAEVKTMDTIKVSIAAVIGTAIEYYDFLIAGFAATLVWPELFFPNSNPSAAALASIAAFASSFLVRPVGAFLFGHFGDRVGRKGVLVWTLLTMGFGSMGIALTPGYAAIGVLAPVLIVLFRLVQGLGVGGEFGGATTWVLEHAAKSKRRAFWTGWVSQGFAVGALAGSFTYVILGGAMSHTDFLVWGWRIPFVLGTLALAVGLVIRYRLTESPVFRDIVAQRKVEKAPSAQVLKEMWRKIGVLSFTAWHAAAFFYLQYTFAIAYIIALGVSRNVAVLTTVYLSLTQIAIIFVSSVVGDKIGRKKVLLISAVATALFVYPYFILLNTKNILLLILGQVVMLACQQFCYGVVGAWYSEHFPAKYRYSGTGLVYYITSLLGSGTFPVLGAYMLLAFGGPLNAWPFIAAIGLGYAVIAALATIFSRETIGASVTA
jgi:MHS family shikimate/dehydroshikimate transporter-like MFS transporter